jgi:pimeloyl-ACP methyl ester carboxylesterase
MRRFHLLLCAVALTGIVVVMAGARGLGRAPRAAHSSFGRGSVIALIHGLGSSPDHWLGTGRLLARRYHVVLVDLPGHGLSEMPHPFSLDRAVDAMEQALEAETSEPVVLVGHSIGGLIATQLALEHPDRVRALVLVETALAPQFTGPDREAMLAALDHDYRGLLRAAYTAFGRDSAQGLELYREVAALDSSAMKRWIRLALAADLSQAAAGLRVPVLAILAERSWPVGEPWRVTAEALGYTRVPNLRAMRIKDCGHFVMLDRPADVAQAIARFAAATAGEPVAGR